MNYAQEDLHTKARDFMDKHEQPGWGPASLDEWLHEHWDELPYAVVEEGWQIVAAFDCEIDGHRDTGRGVCADCGEPT